MKRAKPARVDWSLSPCCGQKFVRVLGLVRCSQCSREAPQGGWTPAERGERLPMNEIHRRNFEAGLDE